MTWQICIIHFEKDYAGLALLARELSLSKVPNCAVQSSPVSKTVWNENKVSEQTTLNNFSFATSIYAGAGKVFYIGFLLCALVAACISLVEWEYTFPSRVSFASPTQHKWINILILYTICKTVSNIKQSFLIKNFTTTYIYNFVFFLIVLVTFLRSIYHYNCNNTLPTSQFLRDGILYSVILMHSFLENFMGHIVFRNRVSWY